MELGDFITMLLLHFFRNTSHLLFQLWKLKKQVAQTELSSVAGTFKAGIVRIRFLFVIAGNYGQIWMQHLVWTCRLLLDRTEARSSFAAPVWTNGL
jgi:ABC-type phosphate/phosphonate transport system permease subunit